MPQRTFQFLSQAHGVQMLLQACQAALADLPAQSQAPLVQVMRQFETSSAVTMFGVGDLNDDPDREIVLTDVEPLLVINRFAQQYESADHDWSRLGVLSREIRAANLQTASSTESTPGAANA